MKKTALLLALALTLGLVGCGTSNTNETTQEATSAQSTQSTPVAFEGEYIVEADYVKNNLDKITLIDARGDEEAAKETIKGAIPLMWQYLATCEDGAPGDENWGCILDVERLGDRLGEKGIAQDKQVVLFAAAQKGWGEDGRIAWELLAAGYKDVKIVNGGIDALKAAGMETAKGSAEFNAVEVDVKSIDQTHNINTEDLKANYDTYKVVDVRADEEYEGKTLYGEAKGGHLPEAIHIRFIDLFQDNGKLKSNQEILAMFEEAGLSKDDSIVTYCTAGIRSAYMELILEMCGYQNVKNYDESYYRWCAVEDVTK